MVDFDALWNYDEPAKTEAAFLEVLPQVAGDAEQHAQLLTQIARAQGLQGRFAEAQATLDHAQALLPAAPSRAHVRLLLEHGRVLNSSGRRDDSQPIFKQAYELAASLQDDFDAVDAAHMLGIVLPADDAVAWNARALAMAEASSDAKARRWAGSLLNNMGWTYHDQGQHEEALSYFQRALQVREAAGNANATRIAKWCVGRELRALNRADEAMSIQLDLLAEWEAAGGEDGYVFEELAECALVLNQPAQAQRYAALAHKSLSQDAWFAAHEAQRLQRLKSIADAND